METQTKNQLSIDKHNWIPIKFGDMVFEPKETSKDPVNEGIQHVVGLEHIEPGDIHLRNSSSLESTTTFTKKFSIGDVLFGRRRAYLKKAALASFNGICSGDITVLRAKNELILPELLPFIVHNEKFFDYAVKHSAGGLSPRVKFKDLANYEFLLPPKDQQAELAELLWAMDEVIENDHSILNNLNITHHSLLKTTFTNEIVFDSKKSLEYCKTLFQTRRELRLIPETWKVMKLGDVIANKQNGFAEGRRDANGIPQLRMNNVTRDGRIDLSKIALVPLRKNLNRYTIKTEDVLFCNTNSDDLVGKAILANSEINDFTFSNHFTRLRSKDNLIKQKFLHLWLKFHFDIGLFERICTKWIGQAAVQSESLLKLEILVPPINEQQIVSKKAFEIEKNTSAVEAKIRRSKELQKATINQIF